MTDQPTQPSADRVETSGFWADLLYDLGINDPSDQMKRTCNNYGELVARDLERIKSSIEDLEPKKAMETIEEMRKEHRIRVNGSNT